MTPTNSAVPVARERGTIDNLPSYYPMYWPAAGLGVLMIDTRAMILNWEGAPPAPFPHLTTLPLADRH